MKNKSLRTFLAAVLAFTTSVSGINVFAAATNNDKDIVILYTNDVHCGVDDAIGYDGLAAYKQDMVSEGNDVLLVDEGDAVQGATIGTLSNGEDIIDIMNAVGYDIAIPGNHEFDYGTEQFFRLSEMAHFSYLSCNFKTLPDKKLIFAPYVIKEMGEKRVAFVGVTTPETLTSSTPKNFQNDDGEYIYSFSGENDGQDLYDAVQSAVDAAHKENIDYCIVMGHLGIEDSASPYMSTDVIANTTGIDVLVDGHSHSTVEMERVKNKDGKPVILTQTGTKLNAIGKLTIDETGLKTELVKDYDKKDESVTKLIEEKKQKNEALLGEVYGHTSYKLTALLSDHTTWICRNNETNLGDFVSDAYKNVTGAEIGLTTGGNLRTDIAEGEITYGTLLNVHPFGNHIQIKSIKGSDLLDALEFGVSFAPAEFGGFPHVSGMTFDVDLDKKPSIETDENGFFIKINEGSERRISNATVNGEPLDPDRYYSVASLDYILSEDGDGNTGYKGEVIPSDKEISDIESLMMYLESMNGEVDSRYSDPEGEERIHFTENDTVAEPTPSAAPSEKEVKFTDITGHWAKDAIETAAGKGIVAGFEDGSFKPDANVTRGQLVSILYRMENEPKTVNANKFTDVKDSAYYTNAIIWANGENIVSGMDDTHFAPDSDITREQLALILFNYKNIEDQGGAMGLAGFADSDEISDWASPAMLWAVKSGIISGMGDGTLNPKGSATRAQIASIMTRLDIKESSETADNPIGFEFSVGVKPVTWEPSPENLIIQTDEARELYTRIKANDYPSVEELKASNVVSQIDELSAYYIALYGKTHEINTPEREDLREKVKNEFLAIGSARTESINEETGKHKYVYDGELEKGYEMELVLGLPAAGKSTMVTDPDSEEMKAFILDCDVIKELIPEYQESHGCGADAVHMESMGIMDAAVKAFTEGDMKGTNVILPLVAGDFDDLMNTYIIPFENAGYNVKAKFVDVEENVSMGRNVARELETGRIINSAVVFSFGQKPKEVYERLAPMINSKGEPYGYDADAEEEKKAA